MTTLEKKTLEMLFLKTVKAQWAVSRFSFIRSLRNFVLPQFRFLVAAIVI